MRNSILVTVCALFWGIWCFAEMPETKEITIEKAVPARALNVDLGNGSVEAWIEVDSILGQDSMRIVAGDVSVHFCKSTDSDIASVYVSKNETVTETDIKLSVINKDLLYISVSDGTLTIGGGGESESSEFVCDEVKLVTIYGSQLCDVIAYLPVTSSFFYDNTSSNNTPNNSQNYESVSVINNASDSSTINDIDVNKNTVLYNNGSSEDNSQRIVIVNADYNSGK